MNGMVDAETEVADLGSTQPGRRTARSVIRTGPITLRVMPLRSPTPLIVRATNHPTRSASPSLREAYYNTNSRRSIEASPHAAICAGVWI